MSVRLVKPRLTELDGLPFLDDTFAAQRLLAMTAAIRHINAEQRRLATAITADDAEAWLAPALAFALATGSTPMPALPLTTDHRQMARDMLGEVTALVPHWRLLLRLPVRYARLYPARGAISASSRAWPQHVLLADEAFATGRELREQLLHELAHQWLYLIEDIWPLQQPGTITVTLPSGTRDRSPAEVLGAAHVAAVLVRLYRQARTPWAARRVHALTAYGTGCLDLTAAVSGDLTEAGTLIAQRLKEAF